MKTLNATSGSCQIGSAGRNRKPLPRSGQVPMQKSTLSVGEQPVLFWLIIPAIHRKCYRLVPGKNGKPELGPDNTSAEISFSLSHTSERILIGVTKKRQIGVDIVSMDPSYQFQDTAEYLMTPAEKVFLERIEPAQRYQVFFRIWAAKEAIIKATGGTLSLMGTTDLSEIIEDILYSPDYSMYCLDTHPPFFLWEFMDGSGHLGAIAVDAGRVL